ncbi:DUF881 domain-containing protein [Viridibacillus arvi]|uniref:NgoFVII family restriction endonuclease n=1 Tax=Viridibacillus arvi TaxID=263475 RepID=A0A0M0LEH5_9BACL|nr:DUF881 domain-containing protein [Viridibacillus arvi]KOO49366.1 hypothetical protein AMD00_13420 [Viridibacillus arvi]
MKRKMHTPFIIVLFIIGFMLAMQYNTVKNPQQRDTRDLWDIRRELSLEKQRHSELLANIQQLNSTISKYENMDNDSPDRILRETVQGLKQEAGLTAITSPGLVLRVDASPEAKVLGQAVPNISPDLLVKLVNDINRFKGNAVVIDRKRIVQTTAIRDINGQTTVNSLAVRTPPFMITIGTSTLADANKLASYLESSSIADDFYLDNLTLSIGKPQKKVTLNGFDQSFHNKFLSETTKGE